MSYYIQADSNKQETKSNTGLIVFTSVTLLIAIAGLVLSILNYFNKGSSNSDCPNYKNCTLEIKNLSTTDLTTINLSGTKLTVTNANINSAVLNQINGNSAVFNAISNTTYLNNYAYETFGGNSGSNNNIKVLYELDYVENRGYQVKVGQTTSNFSRIDDNSFTPSPTFTNSLTYNYVPNLAVISTEFNLNQTQFIYILFKVKPAYQNGINFLIDLFFANSNFSHLIYILNETGNSLTIYSPDPNGNRNYRTIENGAPYQIPSGSIVTGGVQNKFISTYRLSFIGPSSVYIKSYNDFQ